VRRGERFQGVAQSLQGGHRFAIQGANDVAGIEGNIASGLGGTRRDDNSVGIAQIGRHAGYFLIDLDA